VTDMSSPRRVLHIVQSLDTGGAERVVAEYAMAHDRRRYSPEVCAVFDGGYLVAALEAAGVPVHVLGRRARVDPGALLRLASLIAAGRFDVVHNHNFTALAMGAPAAVACGVRTIVRTEHNVSRLGMPKRRLLSRLAALREDAQIAVSEEVRTSHVAAGRLPAERFVTVRNGISDQRLRVAVDVAELRVELGLDRDATVCLSVGSLTPQKDFANLLSAAARVARGRERVQFLVVGAGPEDERLRRRARELGVEDVVRFVGRMTDVPSLLRVADIFVLPSAWEGLPITVLEAMASAVPCVVTNVGGVSEAVEDGEGGIVVAPGDPQALADGISRLAGDPEMRRRMGENAMAAYERSFTARQMVRQTEALYDLASVGRAELASAGPIKVIYVIGQLSFGGAERQVAELAKRLPRDRYEPVVCCLSGEGPLAEELVDAGIRVICIGKRGGVGSGTSLELARLVRSERPAVMHSYLFSANWRTVLVGRLAKVPLVVTSVRNVDIHGTPLFLLVERLLSGLNDTVVANAEAVKDYVAGAHWIDRDTIRVILNGVATERVRSREGAADRERDADVGRDAELDGKGSSDGQERPTVLVVASLTPKKDHATLLRAAVSVSRALPDVRFKLVGDGPLRGTLERQVAEAGISDNVVFAGELRELSGAFREADVCALTSLKEGCSNFILEAMLAARPVVATDAGGNRELVEDGVTGHIVPLGDSDAVARRLVELLSDPKLAREAGEAGRKRAESLFGVERMVDQTVGLYEEKLAARVPGLIEWSHARSDRLRRRGIGGYDRPDGRDGADVGRLSSGTGRERAGRKT